MADTAFQTQYRDETIAAFEQEQSLVRQTVTTEAEIKGNQAVFLVAGSGGAEAVTRGVNGLIPGRADDLQQKTATLAEWHDKAVRTDFNIETSQGNGRQIMQRTTRAVLNRKIDQDIIAALNGSNALAPSASALQMSLNLATHCLAILGNNDVPMDGNISCLISPAANAYLMQTKEFTSADYINNKPFENKPTMFRWAGINWIVHPNLPGAGTSSERLFMYHKSAIGHAFDSQQLKVTAGYNEEHAYSFALASAYMGSVVLQSTGIIEIIHDGSQFAGVAL